MDFEQKSFVCQKEVGCCGRGVDATSPHWLSNQI